MTIPSSLVEVFRVRVSRIGSVAVLERDYRLWRDEIEASEHRDEIVEAYANRKKHLSRGR
jgi:hypothetical protein